MPKETDRTTATKRVKLPSGDIVKVPVITQISFTDASARYQETRATIDNTDASARKVHVDDVYATEVDRDGRAVNENPSQDTSGALKVERIDVWPVIDASERYQETQTQIDNKLGFDSKPPSFTQHSRTHVYRYYIDPQNPDDGDVWIDSELIDEFRFEDASERHQETFYTLTNPTNDETRSGDTWGQAQDDDPDITIGGEGEGTEDNPVRLDPFQNIVNFNSGNAVIFFPNFD